MTRMQVIRADDLLVWQPELVGIDVTGTAHHRLTRRKGAKRSVALHLPTPHAAEDVFLEEHPPPERILLNRATGLSRRRTQFSFVCHGSRSRYG